VWKPVQSELKNELEVQKGETGKFLKKLAYLVNQLFIHSTDFGVFLVIVVIFIHFYSAGN
jgi:hypothetical protein